MNRYFKFFVFFLLLVVCSNKAVAQRVTVEVPTKVSVGENFRLSYIVNTQDVEDFRAGNIPSGIEVIAGPYTSRQSSYQMVNGHTSSSSSITFTYTLYATKQGTYTIPAANAIINGRKIASRSVLVTVVSNAHGANRVAGQSGDDAGLRSTGSHISGNDLFIRVSANKQRVHEQEPIMLTYKVYTLVELTQLKGDMPELTGFHTQEVKLPQQKSFHVERVNGRAYRCVTWSQYVMYPQMTGKLTIPSITFKGIVVQQNRNVDPFEAFFNGGSGYVEVKKEIKAPSLTIQVDPLPNRPLNFSGGVGIFNISAQLNKKEVKSGEPLNIRIVVGGIGNLKLIKQPEVVFPKDFEKYDVKITDKTHLTANGVEGNIIYDFLVVPQNQGEYKIPEVAFTYYDTSIHSYKTIKTQSFHIAVAKGNGNHNSEADYSKKDNDIHNLMEGDIGQRSINDFFFGSVAYYMLLLLPMVTFVILLIVFRKRALEMTDMVKQRGRRANKVAVKRLRYANKLMQEGKSNDFYDEVLRALWGYVGDKLNMPVEKISRDNISDNLSAHSVDIHTIHTFIEALDECEFERYAPGDVAGNMNKTFESAIIAITEIERIFNKRKY